MDKSRNLVQFSAAWYGPMQHDPCKVKLQQTVQGLRDALYTAINQIKSLTEENTALKEKVSLLENAERVESQLQQELKRKDEVLKKAVKRRQARTREYVNCLDLLTKTELQLKKSQEQAKARCDALEASLRDKLAQREESCRKYVQEVEKEWNLHREEGLRKEKEWSMHKEECLRKEEQWRRKESLAEEKISFLISKNKQLQELTSTKRRERPQQETKLHNRQTDKVQKKPESHDKDKFEEETKRSREKQINKKNKRPKKRGQEKEEHDYRTPHF